MKRKITTLNELCEYVHKNTVERGFAVKEIGTWLMLIVSELGKALEADREFNKANIVAFKAAIRQYPNKPTVFKDAFERYIKDTYEDKIANTVIRIADLGGIDGMDLDFHVIHKMAYNSMRPKLHGKKY